MFRLRDHSLNVNLVQFRFFSRMLERKEMVALRHSEKLIPPKFTLPVNLSTKQRGFAAKAAATAEPSSERIVLPAPHMWDTIVLVIQITVIALFALSAWIGIFFIHTLFTYSIFFSAVTAIITSILASLAYRRAYMQRVKQDARLCTRAIPALRKDTWGHLQVVTVDTFSHLAAIKRDRH
jgi:hypothetical protein